MNYSIYFSPTGGTKKVADILANGLKGEYTGIDLCRDIEPLTLCSEDICLVSVPSFGGQEGISRTVKMEHKISGMPTENSSQ